MKKPLYYTLMAIFCAIFLVCAGLLIRYAIRSQENSSGYDDLASRFHGFTNSTTRFLPTTSTPAATSWSSLVTTPGPTTGTTAPTPPPQTSPEISTGATTPGPTLPFPTVPSVPSTSPTLPPVTTQPTLPPETTAPPLPPTTTQPTLPPATTMPTLPPTTLPPATTTQPTVSWPPDPPNMMENMAMLHALNSHTVGWISIPDTNKYLSQGYPVMQAPDSAQWRDYYLTHNFDRKENAYGAIYVQESCDVFKPSDNITLYGHNMADGQMFGFLVNYDRKPQETYEKHKYIYFDTLYGQHTYEIFAVFNTSGTLGVGFPYHIFTNAEDQADFDNFVNTVRELSKIETNLVPRYGDKLLCLSTCSGMLTNGRLVVCAVRIA